MQTRNCASCLDEAMETWKTSSITLIYKIFLKNNLTNEGKCWGFFYFLIKTDFLDSRSFFLPANQNACLTTHNQSKFCYRALFASTLGYQQIMK